MPPRTRIPLVGQGKPHRPIPLALWRGFRQRCPNCGIGASMFGYLGIRETCAQCGEPLGHIKADDGPAYFTVLIAGHVVVPAVLAAEQAWHPDMEVMMPVALAGLGLLIWRLLPRVKGAVLGLMWALGLKGDEVQGDVDRHG